MVGFCEESKQERVGKFLDNLLAKRPAVEGKEKGRSKPSWRPGFELVVTGSWC